tara:strand:- start:4752 stop:4865 length:114 start_codon:yes stop_codon:yes gene_type:complete
MTDRQLEAGSWKLEAGSWKLEERMMWYRNQGKRFLGR